MPSFWSTATVGLIAATTAAGVMASHIPADPGGFEKPKATVYLPIPKKPQQQIANARIDIQNEQQVQAPELWVSEALKQARVVSDAAAPPAAPEKQIASSAMVTAADIRKKPEITVAAKVDIAATTTPAKADPAKTAAGQQPVRKSYQPATVSRLLATLRMQAKNPSSADAAFELSSKLRAAGAKVVEWTDMLEWAADRGHTGSMFKLGTLFRDGDGVKKDTRFSRFWYEMGAAEGHIPSLHNLGVMLVEGKGGPKEPDRGYRLISLAADKGFTDSMKLIAELPAGQ